MRAGGVLAVVAALIVAVGVGTVYAPGINRALDRDPDGARVASAVLTSVQKQRRLVVLSATVNVTRTAHRDALFGLVNANKTLIVPGTMRYELDWSRLNRGDVAWDKAARRLTVTIPDLELAGPDIQFQRVTEYKDGGLMLAVTGVEKALDAENRRAADAKFVAEARNPVLLDLARTQAKAAVRDVFTVPLIAVGIAAPDVVVRFAQTRS